MASIPEDLTSDASMTSQQILQQVLQQILRSRFDKNRYYTLILAKRPRSDTDYFPKMPSITLLCVIKKVSQTGGTCFSHNICNSNSRFKVMINVDLPDIIQYHRNYV